MLTDLFDIIMDSELFKRALLLENVGQATRQYHISIATALQSRMRNYKESVTIFPSAKQCNSKVKNLKAEMKTISLLKKTASGIESSRVEKGHGKWWADVYKIVSSTASANPALLV